MNFKNKLEKKIKVLLNIKNIKLHRTKLENFGDFSFYMKDYSDDAKNILINNLSQYIYKVDFKKGFVNIFLNEIAFSNMFSNINFFHKEKTKKLLIEFGSVNPTGQMHIGHYRNLICGDVLSRFFLKFGFKVVKEYFINDDGGQIRELVEASDELLKKIKGEDFDISEKKYINNELEEILKKYDFKKNLKDFVLKGIVENIKQTLQKIKISFDSWISQKKLNKIFNIKNILSEIGKYVYKKDGALWLKTTKFNDNEDRVIIKQNHEYSYLCSDLVYSYYKSKKDFDENIIILGFDHNGYIERLKAVLKIFNIKSSIFMVQMVNLIEDDIINKMSKRFNNVILINDLIEKFDNDILRIYMISKKYNTHFNIDMKKFKEHSFNNPIYYLKYAYARACSIISKNRIKIKKINGKLLNTKEEKDLIMHLDEFYDVKKEVFKNKEVYIILNYAIELAKKFHSFYSNHKVICKDKELMENRMYLIKIVKIYFENLFDIFGIQKNKKMY